MEEVINEIMEFIRKRTENFSYMDQQLMYDEVARNLGDMSLDALKNEYRSYNKNMEEPDNE